jgi:hypothetical protein
MEFLHGGNSHQRESVADAGDFYAVYFLLALKQDREENPDLQLKPQYWLHRVMLGNLFISS